MTETGLLEKLSLRTVHPSGAQILSFKADLLKIPITVGPARLKKRTKRRLVKRGFGVVVTLYKRFAVRLMKFVVKTMQLILAL